MSKTEFNVKGNNNNIYKIVENNGVFSCECKSFYYRKSCKHIDNVKLTMANKRNGNLANSTKKEMSEPGKIKLAKQSIKTLRNKILIGSTTNKNRLINFKHSDRKRDQVRIVDELPDEIYKDLTAGKSFVFRPLPEPTFQPKDENTKEFSIWLSNEAY